MRKWLKKILGNEKGEGSATGGVGFTGLLAVLLIGLKLGKIITWSWWWVLSPLWIPLAIILPFLMVFLILS